jgi:hypothetical protein
MSSRPNRSRRIPQVVLAATILCLLAACSSAGGSSQATGAPAGGLTASSAPAGSGGDVCASIPQADVQALLAFPITHVADNSGYFSCGYKFSGGTTTFSLDLQRG